MAGLQQLSAQEHGVGARTSSPALNSHLEAEEEHTETLLSVSPGLPRGLVWRLVRNVDAFPEAHPEGSPATSRATEIGMWVGESRPCSPGKSLEITPQQLLGPFESTDPSRKSCT